MDAGGLALWSRETGLLVNNNLLAAAAGVVFVGTLCPQVLELVTDDKITVGAPGFNQTFLPIFGITMPMAGIGPIRSWKCARPAGVFRRAGLTSVVSVGRTAALALLPGLSRPVRLPGIFIALWLAAATLQELGAPAGLPTISTLVSLRRALGLPRSACHRLRIGAGCDAPSRFPPGRGRPDPVALSAEALSAGFSSAAAFSETPLTGC